jgi:hypothetical protein
MCESYEDTGAQPDRQSVAVQTFLSHCATINTSTTCAASSKCIRLYPRQYYWAVNSPATHPTLLRHPVPDGIPFPTETVLALPAAAYSIERQADWWTVRVAETGEAVYHGPGPVEVFVSSTPF